MFGFGIDRLIREPGSIEGRRSRSFPTRPESRRSSSLAGKHSRAFPEFGSSQLFGPEHGIDGGAQDMAGSPIRSIRATGLPVRSLYGTGLASLSPRDEDLDGVDVLVADLQDVGVRFYTFVWTICLAMETCARTGSRLVVCDRPNPLGAALEGEPQRRGFLSFVGRHPVPVRHGMTAGEIALRYRRRTRPRRRSRGRSHVRLGALLGLARGAAFVPPSPNMPTLSNGARLRRRLSRRGDEPLGRDAARHGRSSRSAPRFSTPIVSRRSSTLPAFPASVSPRPFHPDVPKVRRRDLPRHVSARDRRGVVSAVRDGPSDPRGVPALLSGGLPLAGASLRVRSRPTIDLLTGSAEFRELLDGGSDLDGFCGRQREVSDPSPETLIYPERRPFVIGIAGEHNSGKTTLLEKIVPS